MGKKEKTKKVNYFKKVGEFIGNKNFFVKKNTIPIILMIVIGLVAGVFMTNYAQTQPSQDAVNKVTAFLNSKFQADGVSLDFQSSEVNRNLIKFIYKVTQNNKTQDFTVYSDLQGEWLFPEYVETISANETSVEPSAADFDAPNTEKPIADLYVMSFCPYGTLAEDLMLPVVKNLGSSATFDVKFIVNPTKDGFDSLHGDLELNEDKRQVCIIEEYGLDSFWKYVEKFNTDCIDKTSQEAYSASLEKTGECSEKISKAMGLDNSKLKMCFDSTADSILMKHADLTQQNGIRGSPTLLINGMTYTGPRTSEGYKQAVCSGFANVPKECSQAIASNAPEAPAGSC